MQWDALRTRNNELHWSNIYKWHRRWSKNGSYHSLFLASVITLDAQNKLDLSLLHGDGSNTIAKKRGHGIGYSGHKHQKGEKVIEICDNRGNILAPLVVASVNNHDNVLFNDSFFGLLETTDLLGIDLKGSAITFDAGFDTEVNRTAIRGQGLIPIIKYNRRRTRDRTKLEEIFLLNDDQQPIYKERYRIERCFAWEDIYRRLVTRYERLPIMHMGFKELAYSMINLRWVLGKKRWLLAKTSYSQILLQK